MSHAAAPDLPGLLRRGDVVVANDAATIPASLAGVLIYAGLKLIKPSASGSS